MNQKDVEPELDEILKTKNHVLVLFYASWCPFSKRFLPIYEKCTLNNPNPCLRVMIDDKQELCEKYSIEVFPTVLLFENGMVSKRLDGEAGFGLDEKRLKTLLITP
jgi:thiol-disulfide isomerase/thioredoxin